MEVSNLVTGMDSKAKIINQVEYYFGDVNILWDKHLNDIMDNNGWVQIEELLKFKKLEAMAVSKEVFLESFTGYNGALIETSIDNSKIRRCLEKQLENNMEEFESEKLKRSIFAQKIPKESTLNDIIVFFNRFGSVEDVRMFKKETKEGTSDFTGKAHVLFYAETDAENLIQMKNVNYDGKEVRILKRSKYNHVSQEKCLRIYAKKNEGDSSNQINNPILISANPILQHEIENPSVQTLSDNTIPSNALTILTPITTPLQLPVPTILQPGVENPVVQEVQSHSLQLPQSESANFPYIEAGPQNPASNVVEANASGAENGNNNPAALNASSFTLN